MLYELDNGIRILTSPSANTKTCAVGVFVNVGSANETPKQNGISHFLEHMFFKGTTTRTYNQISLDAERFGIEMNAYTDVDQTAYYMTGLGQHVHNMVDILGDMFCNSTFDPDELEREKNVVLQEYKMYQDRPGSVAASLADKLAYGKHPLARHTLGTPRTIKSFTRDDLINYIATHYRGPNVVVGVAGNFNEEDVVAQICTVFGNLLPLPAKYKGRTVPIFTGGAAFKKKATAQCSIRLKFETLGAEDPNYYVAHVASGAVGEGMSSPLFDEVREKRGLCYSVGTGCEGRLGYGTFNVAGSTTPENVDMFVKTSLEVIRGAGDALRDEDMERSKNTILVDLARRQERPFSSLVNDVGDLFYFGHTTPIEAEMAAVEAVTKAQVQDYLRGLVKTDYVLAVVGPKLAQPNK